MAIPITYNLRSLRARWVSATVAVLGIAGTVGVFVAMLAPANAQVRGVSANVMGVRNNVRIDSGRFFQPGLNELIVGRNVAASYSGFELGQTVRFGGGIWTVVGVFDASGSAFDSEVWCDSHVLNQVYLRPPNIYQSVTARLDSASEFQRFKDALTSDPRLNV